MGTDKASARDEVGTSPVAVGLGWFLDALGFTSLIRTALDSAAD